MARPQLRAGLETTVYLARTCKFESIPLQQRVRREPISPAGEPNGVRGNAGAGGAMLVQQTAWLLGYSDVGAFNHAYKRVDRNSA
jgi:hypothetical protein